MDDLRDQELLEEDNESDKTQDNADEQYRQAQAKRMFVIKEEEEEGLSDNSHNN
jgi:hypothetical protein